MNKELELIPEVRFPEFNKNGKWKEKRISKIGETVNGLSGKKGADFGSGKPYVQYKQVFQKSYIDFSECGKVNIADDENQNTLQKGDILFTTSSETPNEVGFASVIINQPEESSYLNSFCFILRPYDLEEITPDFSRFLFRSPIYRKSVSAIAQGSTRYNLSKGAFLKLKVPLPETQEQQKIASCLSSLDELIAAHTDKLQALKDHKKGLMQNLFPQEGETVPKVRFSEFEEDGEWIIVPLKKYIEVIDGDRGKNYPKSTDFSEEGFCVFLNAKNVTKGGFSFNETQCITREKDGILRKGKLSRKDIVLTTRGSLGHFAFYHSSIPYDHLRINSGMVILRIKEKLLPEYFYSYCGSNIITKTIESIAYGNAVQQLTVSGIKSFPLLFPTNKLEQQKIASCLSAVDELITAQAEKIDQLQQHKKGLMQGLFPKIEG